MAMKRYREFDWKITKIAADLKVFFFRQGRVRPPPTTGQRISGFLGLYWRSIVVVLAPLIFSSVMFANDNEEYIKAYRCLFIVMVVSAATSTNSTSLVNHSNFASDDNLLGD